MFVPIQSLPHYGRSATPGNFWEAQQSSCNVTIARTHAHAAASPRSQLEGAVANTLHWQTCYTHLQVHSCLYKTNLCNHNNIQ